MSLRLYAVLSSVRVGNGLLSLTLQRFAAAFRDAALRLSICSGAGMVRARLLWLVLIGVPGGVGGERIMAAEDFEVGGEDTTAAENFGVGRIVGWLFGGGVRGLEKRLPMVNLDEELEVGDDGASMLLKVFEFAYKVKRGGDGDLVDWSKYSLALQVR